MISTLTNPLQRHKLDPIDAQTDAAPPIPFAMTDAYREEFTHSQLAKEVSFRMGYPFPNEKHMDVVFEDIHNMGGTLVGLGGLQNLDLAAVMQASAMVLVDFSPFTSVFLLSFFEFMRTHNHAEFKEVLTATTETRGMQRLINPALATEYGIHPQIVSTAGISAFYRFGARHFIQNAAHRQTPIWQSEQAYDYIKTLLMNGKIQIILGDFFANETRTLIETSLERFGFPVNGVYLSNAPEWIREDELGHKARTLGALLAHPLVNQETGHVMLTTEYTAHREETAAKRRHDDTFSYHVESIGETRQALQHVNNLPKWTARFQTRPGRNLDARCAYAAHKKLAH